MRRFLQASAASFLMLAAAFTNAQNISTVAGTGTAGYSGDGAAATAAKLNNPYALASDPEGNIYIADYTNNRIRRIVALTGDIETLAGTGSAGYSGDGNDGLVAQLNSPSGVAVDVNNALVYVADQANHRVRKITLSSGYITTVAGTGTAGFSNDGGLATQAKLNNPNAVAVDKDGNVYISDWSNYRIRKITKSTGIITTIAGTGTQGYSGNGGPATSAQLHGPVGLAVDNDGNVYITDPGYIRKISASTGNISIVASNGLPGFSGDGGAATSAQLNSPRGITLDGAGNIFIADANNNRVRKVNASDGKISTVAGNGTAGFSGDGGAPTSAELNLPFGVTVDVNGNLYIAEYNNNRIRKVTGVATDIGTVSAVTQSLNIYPVPGKDWINVSSAQGGFNYIRMYDLTGKLVYTHFLDENNPELNFSIHTADMPNGNYIVQLIGRKATLSRQVSIQH